MSTLRYFNWGGRECWMIDLDQLPEHIKKDDVFVIHSPMGNTTALVDFEELSNLRMYNIADPVLRQIRELES